MIRRSKPMWQPLPAGPWSPEQMFETIRLVHMLRSDRAVTRSWASQVFAEQLQRISSAHAAAQISRAEANRYVVTLIRELEQQQISHTKIFGRNSPLIFRGINFDDLLLQEVRLSDAYFSSCTFKASNLAGSQFTRCTFTDCTFDQADMRRSSFAKCRLSACLFRGALLDHTSFRSSSLAECDFESASLTFTRGLPARET
jgi:uncharacterized protein YjbI with pentapeptide repeats